MSKVYPFCFRLPTEGNELVTIRARAVAFTEAWCRK
jgi:hypothetical protein